VTYNLKKWSYLFFLFEGWHFAECENEEEDDHHTGDYHVGAAHIAEIGLL
jgi:hypothetical protein